MARKREPKVQAVQASAKKAVRLELAAADYKRLERQARKLDRSLSYVARMAVLEWVKVAEAESGGK